MAVSQLHRINNSRGQTIVEFALVVSLLLAVLFGIVELGRIWWYSNHLNNSVRAAARYGAVLGNSTGLTTNVKTYLRTELSGFIPADTTTLPDANIPSDGGAGISVTIFSNGTTYNPIPSGYVPRRGSTLTVTAGYNYTILSGNIIPFISGSRILTRSASMLYE